MKVNSTPAILRVRNGLPANETVLVARIRINRCMDFA